MNIRGKIFIWLTVISLALSLTACGEARPESGTYICRGLSRDSQLQPYTGEAEVILEDDGGGLFRFEGTEGAVRWSARGEELIIRIGGQDMAAEIKNDCISLPGAEDSLALFYREGSEIPPELLPVKLPDSFYGWWRITASEGLMPETWIDCCGAFESDKGILSIWDEDGSREEPMGVIELYGGNEADMPQFKSRRGFFWYTEEQKDDFILKKDENSAYTVSGEAADKEGNSFSYEIYLRPWADEWQWEKENEPDKLPYFYNDWYLPLIEAGEPMPDKIEPQGE